MISSKADKKEKQNRHGKLWAYGCGQRLLYLVSVLLQRRCEVGPSYINKVRRPKVLGQARQVDPHGILQKLRTSPQ